MIVKDEKVKRVLEQCRRKIVKMTGKQVSLVMLGYEESDRLTLEQISNAVCCSLDVPFDRVKGKCRKRELVTARYLIFFYSRRYTRLSHNTIAESLGYKDHSSGINAVKRLTGLLKAKDELIMESIGTINQLLKITS